MLLAAAVPAIHARSFCQAAECQLVLRCLTRSSLCDSAIAALRLELDTLDSTDNPLGHTSSYSTPGPGGMDNVGQPARSSTLEPSIVFPDMI